MKNMSEKEMYENLKEILTAKGANKKGMTALFKETVRNASPYSALLDIRSYDEAVRMTEQILATTKKGTDIYKAVSKAGQTYYIEKKRKIKEKVIKDFRKFFRDNAKHFFDIDELKEIIKEELE